MEFSLNLLLIPLLGGYWFMHATHFTRFRAKGLSNYRLLFEAAFWGLMALLGAYVVVALLNMYEQSRAWLDLWKSFVPFQYTGTALGALVIAMLFPVLLNWIWDEETSSNRTILKYGDDLVRMLREAQQSRSAIMATLQNRKVYVGQVMVSANLEPEPPYITILPSLSGFRHEGSLEIQWTATYLRIYEGIGRADPAYKDLRLQDFQVVIPTAEVQSVTPFRHHVHGRHFALKEGDAPPGTATG